MKIRSALRRSVSRRPSPQLAVCCVALASAALIAGCAEPASLPVAAGIGPNPTLPKPAESLIPTVNIAPAIGWPDNAAPQVAAGLAVQPFAEGLDHPRWLAVLPNGDVLVAETNAPPKPEDGNGIKGWIMKLVMKRAGAGVPSANRITLLRDTNGDGRADLAHAVPAEFALAVRHAARRRHAVRGRHRRGARISLHVRRDQNRGGRARRWSSCPPVRSTTTGPRT